MAASSTGNVTRQFPRWQPSISGSVRQHSGPPAVHRTAPQMGHNGPSFRHGSGAQSSIRSSSRDFDRRERSLSRTEPEVGHTIIRTWPTGPQEAMDWAAALDTMVNRVVTLERVNRSHAQLIADETERAVELNNRMNALVQVVQKTSEATSATEKNLSDVCTNVVDRFTTKISHNEVREGLTLQFATIDARLESLSNEFQLLLQATADLQQRPSPYNIATPPTAPTAPGHPRPRDSPLIESVWDETVSRGASPLHPSGAAGPSVGPTGTGAGPCPPTGDPHEYGQYAQAPPTGSAHADRDAQFPGAEQQAERPRHYCRDDYLDPRAQAPPVPVMPPAWDPHAGQGQPSPFQNSYNSPAPNGPMQRGMAGALPATVPPPSQHFGGPNPDAGRMGNGEAINRKTESLRKFNGNPSDFILWSNHFTDHMAKVHSAWRYVLGWMANTPSDLSMARLANDCLGPFRENAADLAVKLEQVIVDWIPDTQYGRREQLCGGKAEIGNGFAMWRRLFQDNRGSGEMIEFAGIEVLREFKTCNKLSEVNGHMDNWKEILDTYGGELFGATKTLRSMFLNIIPKELKSEIMKDEKLNNADHIELMRWVRKRALVLQQENLAMITKRNLTAQMSKLGSVSAMTPDYSSGEVQPASEVSDDLSDAPPWVKHLIAAIAPPPSPSAAARPPREVRGRPTDRRGASPGRSNSRDKGVRPRPRSPSGGGKFRLIGWENKCYHCGSDSHRREDCDSFKKFMAANNKGKPKDQWKPPPGYKSAMGKARDKAREESVARKAKVNSVTGDAEDSASDDDTYSQVGGSFAIRALTQFASPPITAINRFADLDDAQEYDPGMLQALSTWAHKVHTKSVLKKSPVTDPLQASDEKTASWIESDKNTRTLDNAVVVIRSSKDLDRSTIAALPQDRKGKARLEKKIQKIFLAPDEKLAMVDSGSFVHAIDSDIELPGHALRPIDKNDHHIVGETACGGKLVKKGSVVVDCIIDGHRVEVEFDSMKVKTPILSVRKLVRDNHSVKFHKNGGFIHNLTTGKKINFFEFQGVYYLKMKILPPSDLSGIDKGPGDFGRHGA